MPTQAFIDLLVEIHRSIDRVAEDLARDQPALAAALRKEAERIPRPEDVVRGAPPAGGAAPESLEPLLYEALDEGVLDARRFDSLMVRQQRAARTLRTRTP
jgi:hypothetical protein